jgi:hypothetical protein
MFDPDKGGSPGAGADQLVELSLDGRAITVLGALDQKIRNVTTDVLVLMTSCHVSE